MAEYIEREAMIDEIEGATWYHISCQKSKESTTAFYICVLSALRLCVWLFDN